LKASEEISVVTDEQFQILLTEVQKIIRTEVREAIRETLIPPEIKYPPVLSNDLQYSLFYFFKDTDPEPFDQLRQFLQRHYKLQPPVLKSIINNRPDSFERNLYRPGNRKQEVYQSVVRRHRLKDISHLLTLFPDHDRIIEGNEPG
jgi:hypothetical protein